MRYASTGSRARLGALVFEALRRRGLGIHAAACRAGVDPDELWRLCRGELARPEALVAALCARCGLELDERGRPLP